MGIEISEVVRELSRAAEESADTIMDLFTSVLKEQPYTVECEECGKKLDFKATLDTDNDIGVSVERCYCED